MQLHCRSWQLSLGALRLPVLMRGLASLHPGCCTAWARCPIVCLAYRALAAIKHKLANPDESAKNNMAIGEVGEIAREALELTASLCSSTLIVVCFCVVLVNGAFVWGR